VRGGGGRDETGLSEARGNFDPTPLCYGDNVIPASFRRGGVSEDRLRPNVAPVELQSSSSRAPVEAIQR